MSTLRFIVRLAFWLLALLGAVTVAAMVALLVVAPGFERATKAIEDQTVLTLDLADGIPERNRAAWFDPWRSRLSMPHLVLALEAAAKDPRIKGMRLRVGGGSLDMSRAQELRAAIKAFRDGGKSVHAFAETFGEVGNGTTLYYVAAAADRVFLQPSGEVGLLGFRLEMPFIKGALDWLGIEPRTVQRREFKSPPYIFTATTMPEPLRQNLQQLADSWLAQLVADLAADRNVTPAVARSWVDGAPWDGAAAAKQGLVDGLAYWSEARASLGAEERMVSLADYWAQMPDPPANAAKVALVSAIGPVVQGARQKGPFGEEEVIASHDVAAAIAEALEDKVAAIILRIDSPGGSYIAADEIWRQVEQARSAGIPVIASMIGTAASGGYFIAAPAAKIVAEPGTITGSIGVFAGKPVLSGLWRRLGISVEGVSAGAAAGTDSVNQDFTPEAWARLEARMDAIYADFVTKVARGRGLSPEQAEEAAKGQIWSGADAKEMGLVDALGGFATALDLARDAAKLGPDRAIVLVPYPAPEPAWKLILDLLGGKAEAPGPGALAKLIWGGANSDPFGVLGDGIAGGALRMPPIFVNGKVD